MEIYIKPPFPNTGYQIKKKEKLTFYRKEYIYEVELFHHFFIWNFLKFLAGQTSQVKVRLHSLYSLMLDLHYPLTLRMCFCLKCNFEMAIFRINFESFIRPFFRRLTLHYPLTLRMCFCLKCNF